MKKILSFIVMILVCATFMFTGCSLTQINSDKYLDRVVATVSKDNETVISITKRELMNSYRTNAQTYLNLYGYTPAQTIEVLLDGLVERELLILEAKKYIGDLETNNDYIEEYNEVVDDIFAYFDDQILTYENQLRTIRGLEVIDTEEEDEEEVETDYDVYEEYTKKVLYFEETNSYELVTLNEQTGKYERTYDYKLVYNETADKYERYFYNNAEYAFNVPATTKFANITKKTLSSYDYQANNHGDSALTQEAYEMFINYLIKSEEGKNLSTNASEVLQREFDRVKETYFGNKYIELVEEFYNIREGVNNNKILAEYKEKVAESYATYVELGSEGYDEYIDKMNDKAEEVWYHPYGEEFVQVAHVLVKFTDEQLAELEQIQSNYETGIYTSYNQYIDSYNAWLETAGTKARYTYKDLEKGLCTEDQVGNEYGQVISYKQIYEEIENAITSLTTVEEKAVAFNEFVYKYNMDTGSLNQNYYYVVNTNPEVEDKMVEAFANTSRGLIAEGAGSLSEPVLVEAENYSGYHIILAINTVTNLVDIKNIDNFGSGDNFENAIKNLYEEKIMLGTTKTIYDSLYEIVSEEDGFTDYQANVVDTLKDKTETTYFEKYYKDLY